MLDLMFIVIGLGFLAGAMLYAVASAVSQGSGLLPSL